MSMLEVTDLCVNYGGIKALKGISFSVEEGQICTLIGANGAGKSTALRAISGLVPVKSGSIRFKDQEIAGLDTQRVVERGVVLVPEGRRVFDNLTVLENLKIGAYLRKDSAEIARDIEYVYSLFPRLKERHWQSAGTLSGGEQQMLAMGRALMSSPKIILMDEPSMGLSPLFVGEVFKIIEEIKKSGTTVLLVEQNAKKALEVADRAYVLETGKIVLSGNAKDLMNDEAVKKAYLGE